MVGTSGNSRARFSLKTAIGCRLYCRMRLPWMPFCLSSGDWELIDLAPALANEGEDLACDVALDASNGFEFGVSLGDALCDVGLGSGIGPEASDGDDV